MGWYILATSVVEIVAFLVSKIYVVVMSNDENSLKSMHPEGEILKSLRERNGLSAQDVATKLGFTKSYIHRIERGSSKTPKGELLFDFLDLYGVKTKYYMELVRNLTKNSSHQVNTQKRERRHKRVVLTPESAVLRQLRNESGLSARDASECIVSANMHDILKFF